VISGGMTVLLVARRDEVKRTLALLIGSRFVTCGPSVAMRLS
jgi:hypothetical protein